MLLGMVDDAKEDTTPRRLRSRKWLRDDFFAGEVPDGTIAAWISRGVVPHVRIAGRTVMFDESAVRAWAASRSRGGR